MARAVIDVGLRGMSVIHMLRTRARMPVIDLMRPPCRWLGPLSRDSDRAQLGRGPRRGRRTMVRAPVAGS